MDTWKWKWVLYIYTSLHYTYLDYISDQPKARALLAAIHNFYYYAYIFGCKQYCGSVSFWSGSRSADPLREITDLDPAPDPEKNLTFFPDFIPSQYNTQKYDFFLLFMSFKKKWFLLKRYDILVILVDFFPGIGSA